MRTKTIWVNWYAIFWFYYLDLGSSFIQEVKKTFRKLINKCSDDTRTGKSLLHQFKVGVAFTVPNKVSTEQIIEKVGVYIKLRNICSFLVDIYAYISLY